MEYTCRESLKKGKQSIVLDAYSMKITEGEEQTEIPYAFVTGVRMLRFKNQFKTVLTFERGSTLNVVNFTFDNSGNRVEQSHSYNIFLKELHTYLLHNSNAVYVSGSTNEKLLSASFIGLILALASSFGAEYFGFNLFYVRILAVTVLIAFILVCLQHFFKPTHKKYQPDNIPAEFLPEN